MFRFPSKSLELWPLIFSNQDTSLLSDQRQRAQGLSDTSALEDNQFFQTRIESLCIGMWKRVICVQMLHALAALLTPTFDNCVHIHYFMWTMHCLSMAVFVWRIMLDYVEDQNFKRSWLIVCRVDVIVYRRSYKYLWPSVYHRLGCVLPRHLEKTKFKVSVWKSQLPRIKILILCTIQLQRQDHGPTTRTKISSRRIAVTKPPFYPESLPMLRDNFHACLVEEPLLVISIEYPASWGETQSW